MAIRERLDALSRAELAGLVAVIALTIAGAGLWYVRSLPRPVDVAMSTAPPIVAAVSGAPASGAAFGSASVSPSPAELIVDVAGLVRRPGVYTFPPGSRVIDAIHRAGGPLPKADLSVLNLAAPLTDGTQILVGDGSGAPASGSSGTSGGVPGALVNINTASESELEALNGVGPVTANAIIQYRTEHGPFATVDDLLNVSGIGPATLEDLRPQVTV
ncbi:MAG TPA: ComEA family DNA-binding protein [Actinomycetota bacterium]|nr:ComEA family DNA-binding protein [Actinomycetota bacterium]